MAPSMRGNLLVVCNCNNLFEVVDIYSFFCSFFFFGLSLAFLSKELVAVEWTAFVIFLFVNWRHIRDLYQC